MQSHRPQTILAQEHVARVFQEFHPNNRRRNFGELQVCKMVHFFCNYMNSHVHGMTKMYELAAKIVYVQTTSM